MRGKHESLVEYCERVYDDEDYWLRRIIPFLYEGKAKAELRNGSVYLLEGSEYIYTGHGVATDYNCRKHIWDIKYTNVVGGELL